MDQDYLPSIVFTQAEDVAIESRQTTNDNLAPEVRDMVQYLVSICILNNRIENQIAVYESSASPVLTPYSPTEPSHKRRSISDKLHELRIDSYSGSAASIPSSERHSYFSKETLPNDFVLELRRKLKKSLLPVQYRKYHKLDIPSVQNAITKKIYSSLVAELTENFNERVNRSRRPEDLIVLFCTTAHKVLKPEKSDSEELETHLKVFVKYLIDVLSRSRKGYNFTHRSLIRRLESYLNTLKKGNALQPAVTHATVNHDLTPRLEVPLVRRTKKLVPNPDITFFLADMPLVQYIGRLFNLSNGYMQYMIDDLTYSSTESTAFADLIKCRKTLAKSDLHPTYLPGDFTDPDNYEKWKSEELSALENDIQSLRDSIPVYKDYKDESDAYYDAHDCVYVPRYPIKYYNTLISMCIQYDSTLCEKDNFEFSAESSSLLQKTIIYWRLTAVSESMIMLQEASKLATKHVISFRDLCDQLFPYAMEGLKTASKGNPENRSLQLQEWTSLEKSIAYLTMSNTLEMCVFEIVEHIDLTSNDVQPGIEKIMTFINGYVVPFSTFKEFPPLKITDNHYMAVKEKVSAITEARFQRESLRFPLYKTDTSVISFENLLSLINEVKSTTKRIHRWYQSIELFGFIDLAGLATQFYVIAFIKYLRAEVILKKELRDPALYDHDSYSYEDFDDILTGISDITYIFERSMDQRATSDHEDAGVSVFIKMRKILAPLLLRKIDCSGDKLLEWAGRIFKKDTFEPQVDSIISTSIIDLFTSFAVMTKAVTNQKWGSPSMNAEFCNSAMRVSFLYHLSRGQKLIYRGFLGHGYTILI